MVADLDTMGFQVEEAQSFATDVSAAIKKLKDKDIRIVLGNFNETWAKRVFCEAHKVGMFGRKYQWLIMGAYTVDWWKETDEALECAQEDLRTSLEGCILTDLLPLSTSGEITVSGIVSTYTVLGAAVCDTATVTTTHPRRFPQQFSRSLPGALTFHQEPFFVVR
ncbi:hypothetical protein FOCC_FOCC010969 [Frankliniella occidentalis]|nr:hypothetical protein FOCC_FOCC010969 [Frankliniella occidentalis]